MVPSASCSLIALSRSLTVLLILERSRFRFSASLLLSSFLRFLESFSASLASP